MSGYQDPLPVDHRLFRDGCVKPQQGIDFSVLVDTMNLLTAIAKSKIAIIRSKKSAMSIADMFDLQMAMNKLDTVLGNVNVSYYGHEHDH